MRLIAAAALALGLALAGCGDGDDEAVGASPSKILSQAAAVLDAQSTLAFSFEYARTRADRPDEPERYGAGEGSLDLAAGRSRLRFQLDLGLRSTAGSTVDEPFEVRWDERSVEVELHGEPRRLTRERARRSGGLVGRLPDEPEAIIELPAHGRDARLARSDVSNGAPMDVLAFDVDAGAAGRLGVPAELTGAATSGLSGEQFEVEAWIDEERVTRRLLVTIALDPCGAAGGSSCRLAPSASPTTSARTESP